MASKKLLEDTPGSSDFETEEETEYSDETPTPRKQPVAPAAATVREGNDDERSAPSVANARTAVPAAARAKAANSVSGDSFEYEDEEEYSYTNTSELAKPSPKPQQLAKTAVAAPAAGASKPAVVAPVTVHAISDSAESTEQSPVASARKPAPAKFGGGKGKSEDSPRAAGKGNTRRGMSVDSFEDSEQQRTKPRAAVPPSGRMDDDNFDSDTDAVLGAAGFGANYERATVRGEELSDMGGRGGGMLSSSMSEEDDGRRLPLMPAARLRFVQLPEPLPPAGKRTDNGLVTGKVELEDVIDVLDHTDPMLRITQSKIRGYRDYLHVVEREEVNLIRDFTSDVGKFAAQQDAPKSVADQEAQRVRFEERLSALRDRRAQWRGMLYDAMQERESIIHSHLQRHGIHYRAHEKLSFWQNKSGLDWWMAGFFALTILVNVCYIVFLTFPAVAPPVARVVLNAAQPIEFNYRITVLVSLFVVVGLSFWMASFKRFQWGALSLNVLFVGWAVEWGLLMHVFFQWAFVTGFKQIPFTAKLASLSLYSAAAVLVSHAVLLGRIDARQGLVMATLECIAFAVIVGFQSLYSVVDNGGAVSVFIFGGVFGLAASLVYALTGGHHKPNKPGHVRQNGKAYNEELKSNSHPRRHSYRSTGFAWIGTLVLWTLWPAFNAAFAPSNTHGRVMATTFTALMASCVTAISLSHLLQGGMHLRSFLNATLAGGVAMGCAHSALVPPWIAALLGVVGAVSAVLGEWALVGALEDSIKLYDTQGVLWTLVVPASLGWLVAEIVTGVASNTANTAVWGVPYTAVFGSANQAGYLAASWIIALALAVGVGALAGLVLHWTRPKPQYWTDSNMFATTQDYAAY